MPDNQSVIARRDGRVGRILLNRPKALNALDLRHDPRADAACWRNGATIRTSMPS